MGNSEKWKWCLHCQRCYLEGEFKVDDSPEINLLYQITCGAFKRPGLTKWANLDEPDPLKCCPYPECDGSLVGDSWDWDVVRKRHPSWPETPIRGVEYDPYD